MSDRKKGLEEMAQQLRALAALQEDLNSVLRIYVRQLTTLYILNSSRPKASDTCTLLLVHIHITENKIK